MQTIITAPLTTAFTPPPSCFAVTIFNSGKPPDFPARRTGRRMRHVRADSWLHHLKLLLGGLPMCSDCVQSLKASRDQLDKAEIPRLVSRTF